MMSNEYYYQAPPPQTTIRKGNLPMIIKKVKSRLRQVITKLAILAYNSKSLFATEALFSFAVIYYYQY